MKNTTQLLPGLHLKTLRRKPRSSQQKLADEVLQLKQRTFNEMGQAFKDCIPSALLHRAPVGQNSRHRVFSKENTFWAFMGQVFSEDGSCQEVVRKFQAYLALKGTPIPSSSTASYCAARKRLKLEELSRIFANTAESMDKLSGLPGPFGRRVIVVDGTGVSMPDTEANQAVWPQQSLQKPGCGFPLAKLLGCFSLKTGVLLNWEMGNKHHHELNLFSQVWDTFQKDDIVLADKGFCAYYDIVKLSERGIDTVVTLAHRKPVNELEAVKKLTKHDLIVRWKRPIRTRRIMRDDCNQLPEDLILRQVQVDIQVPGFRTRRIYIITTLLDPKLYPADELADLYFRRWDVELFFRDIKTTLGMDVLRCKSPDMVRKEVTVFLTAYNCLRRLMCDAAIAADMPVRRVSFKGAVQALRSWTPHLHQRCLNRREALRLIIQLYEAITNRAIPLRPGRTEPRARKRRPKNYQLLNAPRHEINVPNHRNNYRAKPCKNTLN